MSIIRKKYSSDAELKAAINAILVWMNSYISDDLEGVKCYDGADAFQPFSDLFEVPAGMHWNVEIFGYTHFSWRLAYWTYHVPSNEDFWALPGKKQYHVAIEVPNTTYGTLLALSI